MLLTQRGGGGILCRCCGATGVVCFDEAKKGTVASEAEFGPEVAQSDSARLGIRIPYG
jgi:hypothetical protein